MFLRCAVGVIVWAALLGIGWANQTADPVAALIEMADRGASESQMTAWLESQAWPLIDVRDLMQLLRSSVPTSVILQWAKRATRNPDVSRMVQVEGHTIWLKGAMRLVIFDRAGRRTWMLTNRSAQLGTRREALSPGVQIMRVPKEIRVIHEYAPSPRPVAETPPEPDTSSPAPVYLFPNPVFWQLTCLLQGILCDVVRPVPVEPIPPALLFPPIVRPVPSGPIPPTLVTPPPPELVPPSRFADPIPTRLGWRFRVPSITPSSSRSVSSSNAERPSPKVQTPPNRTRGLVLPQGGRSVRSLSRPLGRWLMRVPSRSPSRSWAKKP